MPTWEELFKDFDKKLETDLIDEFIKHFTVSVNKSKTEQEYKITNVSSDCVEDIHYLDMYRDYLNEQFIFYEELEKLGYELSIIAIFKMIELQTKNVIRHHIPNISEKRLNFKSLKSALTFNLESIAEFSAFNELRLINNAIKHEGIVSSQLAKEFPVWTKGQKFSVPTLSVAYTRLKPKLKEYMSDLASKIHAYASS